MNKFDFRPGDALIVVDVQNDFCPGGALPVTHGNQVVPVLNRWIKMASAAGLPIFASRDWHPPDHMSFKDQGGIWPPHCVRETWGALFHHDLKLPPDTEIVTKGDHRDFDQYSAFHRTDLAERLRSRRVNRIWIGGLTRDYCVLYSVIDAREAGFEVHVIKAATLPVDVHPGDGDRALEEMVKVGAVIEDDAGD